MEPNYQFLIALQLLFANLPSHQALASASASYARNELKWLGPLELCFSALSRASCSGPSASAHKCWFFLAPSTASLQRAARKVSNVEVNSLISSLEDMCENRAPSTSASSIYSQTLSSHCIVVWMISTYSHIGTLRTVRLHGSEHWFKRYSMKFKRTRTGWQASPITRTFPNLWTQLLIGGRSTSFQRWAESTGANIFCTLNKYFISDPKLNPKNVCPTCLGSNFVYNSRILYGFPFCVHDSSVFSVRLWNITRLKSSLAFCEARKGD